MLKSMSEAIKLSQRGLVGSVGNVYQARSLNKLLRFFPRNALQKHRSKLNSHLAKKRNGAHVTCCSLSWADVAHLYEHAMNKSTTLAPEGKISKEHFTKMLADIDEQDKWTGPIFDVNPPKWRKSSSVEIVLRHVTNMLPRDFVLIRQPCMMSNALLASGRHDFVIERHGRKVVVIKTTKDDFNRGQAQLLVLLEIAHLANKERGVSSNVVWGVVSNYEKWMLYRYTKTRQGVDIAWGTHHITEINHHNDVVGVARRLLAMLT